MKVLKYLLIAQLIYIFNFPMSHATKTRMGGVEFSTGSEYWPDAKTQYQAMVTDQFTPRHKAYAQWEFFSQILEMEKNNHLATAVHFSVHTGEGIDLDFKISQGGPVELQLFLAFNEALVHIFEVGSDLYNKSQYIKGDLMVMKDFFSQVLVFLSGVKNISNYVFNNEAKDFNEEKFLKSLNEASYTPAKDINIEFQSWIMKKKFYQGGKISLAEYIDYYTDWYSKIFTNQYVFLMAHLKSEQTKTKLQLKRKLPSALKDFTFNLNTINLLDTSNTEPSEGSKPVITSTLSTSTNLNTNSNITPESSSKKKKTKKKKNKNINTPKTEVTDAVTTSIYPTTQSEKVEENSEVNTLQFTPVKSATDEAASLPVDIAEKLLASTLEDNKEKENKVESKNTADTLSSTGLKDTLNETAGLSASELPEGTSSENKEQPSEEKETFFKDKENEETFFSPEKKKASSSSSSSNAPSSKNSDKVQKQISQMQKLNAILDENDGGPSAGMKTRKFLRLCAALNKGGFFSEFSSNEKEVKIKVDSLVSVLHVDKHSARRKSPGVSTNTAKKLQEIIEIIKNSK